MSRRSSAKPGERFGDIDKVFALDGETMAQDSLSRVLRVGVGGKRYYVKRYSGNGKNLRRRWFGLRRWLGPPRVRAEWRNLLAFRAWGIPTATLVAYGLERRLAASFAARWSPRKSRIPWTSPTWRTATIRVWPIVPG